MKNSKKYEKKIDFFYMYGKKAKKQQKITEIINFFK